MASLVVAKDRLGQVLAKSSDAAAPVAANVEFDSTGDRLVIRYLSPGKQDTGDFTVKTGSTSGSKPKKSPTKDEAVEKTAPGKKGPARLLNEVTRAQILTAMRGGKWLSRLDVFEAAGLAQWHDHTQRSALKDLLAEGVIERSGTLRDTKYRLTTTTTTI